VLSQAGPCPQVSRACLSYLISYGPTAPSPAFLRYAEVDGGEGGEGGVNAGRATLQQEWSLLPMEDPTSLACPPPPMETAGTKAFNLSSAFGPSAVGRE
jgi:hypothetical protein